jgi:hypothetical protein
MGLGEGEGTGKFLLDCKSGPVIVTGLLRLEERSRGKHAETTGFSVGNEAHIISTSTSIIDQIAVLTLSSGI